MTLGRIAEATVRFPRRRGQGVVVPGRMIVTAAHVIKCADIWRRDAFGDPHLEEVWVGGRRFKADVYAVEPISDIAVLGVPDTQAFEDAMDFQDYLETVAPVPICTKEFPLRKPFPVHMRTHTGRWVGGLAQQFNANASVLVVEADEDIRGGTSGGPVVTHNGHLLGVLSSAGGVQGSSREVTLPRLHLTVPGFLLRLMLDPEWEVRRICKMIRKKGL